METTGENGLASACSLGRQTILSRRSRADFEKCRENPDRFQNWYRDHSNGISKGSLHCHRADDIAFAAEDSIAFEAVDDNIIFEAMDNSAFEAEAHLDYT